ncbi:MAG: hypothetical protein RIF32_02300 [Leptospirales bacterium]
MQFISIKRILLAALAAFLSAYTLDVVISLAWLSADYAQLAAVFRAPAELQARLWLGLAVYAVYYVMFAGLFARLHSAPAGEPPKAKGVLEVAAESAKTPAWWVAGFGFGVFMALLFSVPSALMQYVYYPLPLALALKWIVSGFLAQTLSGVVVSAILYPRSAKLAARVNPGET